MTASDRRSGENALMFPEEDELSFSGSSSWDDFGSASKDFTPQKPRRRAPLEKRRPRRRNSMIETYCTTSTSSIHSCGALGSSPHREDNVFGSDVLAAEPWVDFHDEFGMRNHYKDRDNDSFNPTDITSDSSEGAEEDVVVNEEEQFVLRFPQPAEGEMPLRDHNEPNRSRMVTRGREGRRGSSRTPSNEGAKRRNRSRSKPSFVVAPVARRTRSLSIPKKKSTPGAADRKSNSGHSRKTVPASTEMVVSSPNAKKVRSEEKEKQKKSKGEKSPKTPGDRPRKTRKASKDKPAKGSRDKSPKTHKNQSDKSPKVSKDKSSKGQKISRSKSPKDNSSKAQKISRSKSPKVPTASRSKTPEPRDKSDKIPKAPKPSRSQSPGRPRSGSSMSARDRSSKHARSKSPMPVSDALSQKKKGQTLFASPLPTKSYLSRGTQKRCYAGVSKEINHRQRNIKKSLANLLNDVEGSIHRRLHVNDEESIGSTSIEGRKRSSSVPKRSGSDSSTSEHLKIEHGSPMRQRRYRRHSIIGSAPSDVAKRCPDSPPIH